MACRRRHIQDVDDEPCITDVDACTGYVGIFGDLQNHSLQEMLAGRGKTILW
jgi:hypothetical protein